MAANGMVVILIRQICI